MKLKEDMPTNAIGGGGIEGIGFGPRGEPGIKNLVLKRKLRRFSQFIDSKSIFKIK